MTRGSVRGIRRGSRKKGKGALNLGTNRVENGSSIRKEWGDICLHSHSPLRAVKASHPMNQIPDSMAMTALTKPGRWEDLSVVQFRQSVRSSRVTALAESSWHDEAATADGWPSAPRRETRSESSGIGFGSAVSGERPASVTS